MNINTLRGIAMVTPIAMVVAMPGVSGAQDLADELLNADNWDVSVGAGVLYGPRYEGSAESEASPLPAIDIEWNDRVFLNPEDGLGVRVYRGEALEVSTSIGYDVGRKESDSRSELRGLGNIDGSATGTVAVEYDLGLLTPSAELTRQLGGAEGLVAEFGVESMIPLSGMFPPRDDRGDDDDGPRGPAIVLGLSTEWADGNYMSDYFGVTASQAAASGLPGYTAGAGFKSAGAEVGFRYPFLENWVFGVAFEYSRLIGDAAKSPVVRRRNQFAAGSFISYRF